MSADEALSGLKALPYAFPRTCRCCGRVYQTAEEFLSQTRNIRDGASSLKEGVGDYNRVIVVVFRNCICGSTLMDEFQNRRDDSAEGQRRREQYELQKARTGD